MISMVVFMIKLYLIANPIGRKMVSGGFQKINLKARHWNNSVGIAQKTIIMGKVFLMFTYLWNDPSRQTAYMWPWLPKAQIQAHSWVKKNTLWFPRIRRAQNCSDHLIPPPYYHRSWSWPPGLGHHFLMITNYHEEHKGHLLIMIIMGTWGTVKLARLHWLPA